MPSWPDGAVEKEGPAPSGYITDGPSGYITDGPSGYTSDGPSGHITDGPSGYTADGPSGYITDRAYSIRAVQFFVLPNGVVLFLASAKCLMPLSAMTASTFAITSSASMLDQSIHVPVSRHNILVKICH